MADPAQIDLTADRRLKSSWPLVVVGENWTGADFDMFVKQVPDASGSPIINLDPAAAGDEGIYLDYAGTDTVANHIAAGRLESQIYDYVNAATGVNYAPTDSVVLSKVTITVDDFSLSGPSKYPFPEERGNPMVLYYDFLVALAGGDWAKKAYGKYTVRPAVTRS